ncbi:MAG: PIN domain-containing protein [Lachnospiraceae bacterium]|nr:PIN domain-containing protein [Lachnospiraceae bacterium]
MRCLIDANILLDVLANREPFVTDSSKIWKLCETGQIEGFVSSLTFADLVYVLRKELDPEKIEATLNSLKLIFAFAELNEADLTNAAALKWKDYEDALQSVTASRIKADYIITRNVRDYKKSLVIAFTPTELLSRI